MALPSIKNSVGMAVTAVADAGVGTLTVGAALSGGYQTAGTAYGADANIDIRVDEGNNWEVCRDCFYDHSELTVTRGTQEDGSSGTSTRVAFTTAAKVYAVESAGRLVQQTANINSIDGLLCGYSASTTAAITAGYCWIEGVRYAQASATTLSLESGNEIGGSSIAADKLLYIYAYNNSGSIAYKWDLRSSTSDDPLFSEEWQYWYHPSSGVSYRLIGVLRTLVGSAALDLPQCRVSGRRKRTVVNKTNPLLLTVTGTAEGSIALAAYVPKNGTKFVGYMGASLASGAPAFAQSNFSLQSGVPAQIIAKGWSGADLSTLLFGQNSISCNSTDTIYAAGNTSPDVAKVYFIGFEYEV